MNVRTSIKIIIGYCLLIGFLCVVGTIVFFLVYAGVRPSGPYDALVSTNYFFHSTGTIKEMSFSPRFCRNHEIAITSTNPFPTHLPITCRVRAQVYRFGRQIDDQLLSESSRTYADTSLKTVNSISYHWIRTLDMIPGTARVKLSVVEGDPSTAKHTNDFMVIIRASPYI